MMTPALGFSAPNRAYPLSTHLRGFVAHLVFGHGGRRRHRDGLASPAATPLMAANRNDLKKRLLTSG